LPIFHRPEKLSLEIRHAVERGPAIAPDVRELERLHVGEAIDEQLVEARCGLHRPAILRSRRILRRITHRLDVPLRSELIENARGIALTLLELLRRPVRVLDVLIVDAHHPLKLPHNRGLWLGRDGRLRNLRLPLTERVAVGALGHQAVISRDRLRPLTRIEVEISESLKHLIGLILIVRVALEEGKRAIWRTDS